MNTTVRAAGLLAALLLSGSAIASSELPHGAKCRQEIRAVDDQADADIQAIDDKKALTDEIIKLHMSGVYPFFTVSSGQDIKDATEVIAQVDQGGIADRIRHGLDGRTQDRRMDHRRAKHPRHAHIHPDRIHQVLTPQPARPQYTGGFTTPQNAHSSLLPFHEPL